MFFPQGCHISRFLCILAQKEFFSDGPKGFEYIWHLWACSGERQLTFSSFWDQFKPCKSAAFFSIAKFYKYSAKCIVFGAAKGSQVLLCWGRCTKISTFLRDPPHPSENGNIHLIDRIADFLHNKLFFLIAPRDLHFLGPLGSIFSAPEHVQHLFQPLGMLQNGVFSLRISHIAISLYFYTKGIFSEGPKGFECIWDLCACS